MEQTTLENWDIVFTTAEGKKVTASQLRFDVPEFVAKDMDEHIEAWARDNGYKIGWQE